MCAAAVGLTGDICRALKNKVLPYCDEIVMLLLENLRVSIFNLTHCVVQFLIQLTALYNGIRIYRKYFCL